MPDKLLIKIALFAAVILPFWNIPLMARIIKRKSSQDVSLYWACGVWICLLFMFPAAVISSDLVWKTFNVVNFILFSGVLVITALYRKK